MRRKKKATFNQANSSLLSPLNSTNLTLSSRDNHKLNQLLSKAIKYNQIDVIGQLKEVQGAGFLSTDLHLKTVPSLKPLSFAAYNGKIQLMEYFIELDANCIKAKDKCNTTALHWAAKRGNYKAAKLLVELGIDVNVKDKLDNTALHYAARNGWIKIIKLLCENGADPHLKNKNEKMTSLSLLKNWVNLTFSSDHKQENFDYTKKINYLRALSLLKEEKILNDGQLTKYSSLIDDSTLIEGFKQEKTSKKEAGKALVHNLHRIGSNYKALQEIAQNEIISIKIIKAIRDIVNIKADLVYAETIGQPLHLVFADMFNLCKTRKLSDLTGTEQYYLSDDNQKSILFQPVFHDVLVKIVEENFPHYKATCMEINAGLDSIEETSKAIGLLYNYDGQD
ncbi:MAG: hypothetical protein K0Q51_177 [Rickettsiaceae bacterium]|jgi:hypothetical protein|nr:hypothetical protein [Rickettsiaceae bacterium]